MTEGITHQPFSIVVPPLDHLHISSHTQHTSQYHTPQPQVFTYYLRTTNCTTVLSVSRTATGITRSQAWSTSRYGRGQFFAQQ